MHAMRGLMREDELETLRCLPLSALWHHSMTHNSASGLLPSDNDRECSNSVIAIDDQAASASAPP